MFTTVAFSVGPDSIRFRGRIDHKYELQPKNISRHYVQTIRQTVAESRKRVGITVSTDDNLAIERAYEQDRVRFFVFSVTVCGNGCSHFSRRFRSPFVLVVFWQKFARPVSPRDRDKDKRERMEREALLELLFAQFGRRAQWTLRDLQDVRTSNPFAVSNTLSLLFVGVSACVVALSDGNCTAGHRTADRVPQGGAG